MPVGNIGGFYNAKNVRVGSAVGFISPVGTADPADTMTVFDPAAWGATLVMLKSTTPPTGGTFTLTATGGPIAAPAPTAGIAFGAAASVVKAALDLTLPAGYASVVTGAAGGPYHIAFTGPDADEITVTIDGTLLTGGTGTSVATDSPWVSAGATEQGWQVNWNPTTQNINIDEQQTPVDQQMTDAVLTFVANLSEDTVQSWGFALNADKTVTAPSTGIFGKTTLRPSRALKRYKVALETQSGIDTPVRWIVEEMTCAANVGSTFRRAAGQRLVPVTFTSVCDIDQIQRVEITAAAT